MRSLPRILALLVLGLALTLGAPCAHAEEVVTVEEVTTETSATPEAGSPEGAEAAKTDEEKEKEKKEKEEEPPPPPATTVLYYDPNGGVGSMDATVFTEGQPAKLERNTFTRSGYTFEGWSTSPDGSGEHFADGVDYTDQVDFSVESSVLYAQWGSQIYLIRYSSGVTDANSTPARGTMSTQFAVHDAQVALMGCGYERDGYVATGWLDSHGAFHEFGSVGVNFVETTTTTSWEMATIGVELVRGEDTQNFKWSCQGSVVFEGDNGDPWVAVAFINYDANYRKGSLETYDSELIVCDLQTGQLMKHASGLMLEHGNDIAYNPDNGHFYVAQGGLHDGFPNGIVELDADLNEVRTITPAGTHHIWNITYADGIFYAIGNVDGDSFARGNPEGETSDLIRLDADLNVIDMRAIDFSSEGFSGQGMACDGDELYAILVNFGEVEAAKKQRLSIFTLDGEARGTQYIDIAHEVESSSWLDGHMYFSINGADTCTLYGTDLASTMMTCVWKPNNYRVEFEAPGVTCTSKPEGIDATYDEAFHLPEEEPVSPGYDFVGWNTEPDGSGDAYQPGERVKNLVLTGTITLYAQWERPASLPPVADQGTRVHGRRFRPGAHERRTRSRKQAKATEAAPATEQAKAATADASASTPLITLPVLVAISPLLVRRAREQNEPAGLGRIAHLA